MKLSERIIQAIPYSIREKLQPKPEPNKLMTELEEVKDELLRARIEFDTLTNLDLIESCIYQLESLEVRYNYLIKQARQKGLCYSELPIEEAVLETAS